jgi:RNA polymerase sigma-70 factor (sigma-E family)
VAVASSEVAFGELVASSSPMLLRAAWLLTGDESLARDLVQAAWERAWARWDIVATANEPAAYVRTVMTSIFLTWRRRRWWGEIPTSSPWDATTAVDETDNAVVRTSVLAALGGLSARQRAVVVLRYFLDLTETQTAAELGCSVGSVKSHSSRALQQLRSAPELDGLWHSEAIDDRR